MNPEMSQYFTGLLVGCLLLSAGCASTNMDRGQEIKKPVASSGPDWAQFEIDGETQFGFACTMPCEMSLNGRDINRGKNDIGTPGGYRLVVMPNEYSRGYLIEFTVDESLKCRMRAHRELFPRTFKHWAFITPLGETKEFSCAEPCQAYFDGEKIEPEQRIHIDARSTHILKVSHIKEHGHIATKIHVDDSGVLSLERDEVIGFLNLPNYSMKGGACWRRED